MTRSTKASERAKRATTCQDVQQDEFNQVYCEQKSLRIVHRDKTKDRVA
jgi:hypothetical protein